MKIKPIVIYHRADFDGIFCREIAKKFLPEAELIGWDYGDPHLEFPKAGSVYVLDLSPECFWASPLHPQFQSRLIWIDHHKSAIEKFSPDIAGYRIDGVAACRLAWQWFAGFPPNFVARGVEESLPSRQHYIDRIVSEPLAVRLAGEYDIWDKRDPNAELFQHGLRSQELTADTWEKLLDISIEPTLQIQVSGIISSHLLQSGRVIQYAKSKENESIIKAHGYSVRFEGLNFLACNHARFNSLLFTAGLTPAHDACLGYCFDGQQFKVSLYHAPGKEHHDLSLIAKKYGGGGHRGACGFRCETIPWSQFNKSKGGEGA